MKKLLSLGISLGLLNIATKFAMAETFTIIKPSNMPPDAKIGNIIGAIVGFMLLIAAVAAFLFLILGGIQWITSGGDKAGMEAARNRITAAIVGLIIVAASWAVMVLIGQFIGFDILAGNIKIPSVASP